MRIVVGEVRFNVSHRLEIKAMSDGYGNLVFIPEDEDFKDFDDFEFLLEAQNRHPCHWTESGTDSVLMSNGTRHWIRDPFGNETEFPKFSEACVQFNRLRFDDI